MVSSWLGREALLYLATPPRHDEDTPRSKGHERFMFTGHKGDGESGLYYAPERYYSPFQARWTTRDPLGMVDGPNVYAYVRGNVIILVDPYGPYFWHWDRELDGNPRDYLFEGGAAAFDGFFPFGNPLQDVYANPDGSIPVAHRWSRVLGAVSPMIGGAGVIAWGGRSLGAAAGVRGHFGHHYVAGWLGRHEAIPHLSIAFDAFGGAMAVRTPFTMSELWRDCI